MKRTIIILALISLPILYWIPFKAHRPLEVASFDAFDTVLYWQKKLQEDSIFDYKSACRIFSSKDVLNEINLYEEKMRNYYKIKPDCKISLIGELMRFHKDKFLLDIHPNDVYVVIKYSDKKRDWITIDAIQIPIHKNNVKNREYAYLKIGNCNSIEISDSRIGNNSFLSLLGIDENGKISEELIEKLFLEKVTIYNVFQNNKEVSEANLKLGK